MDYKEKYEQALENMRKFRDALNNHEVLDLWVPRKEIVTDIEYYFPELKESEDEKIIKELITHCRNTRCVTEEGAERIAKWIAWLEKQEGCEHIKKEWTTSDAATLKELIDFLENGTAKLQHDLTRYANWLKIQFTPIEKKSEQKSTWSEEDEEMFKSIMATCELAEQERDSSPARHLLEMQLNWLKSLKNRIKNGGY